MQIVFIIVNVLQDVFNVVNVLHDVFYIVNVPQDVLLFIIVNVLQDVVDICISSLEKHSINSEVENDWLTYLISFLLKRGLRFMILLIT